MSSAQEPQLRASLTARLEDLGGLALTLLSAPGGYGKTTLARSWIEALRDAKRPAAWLTLSGVHGDQTLFLEDFLESVRAALPPRAVHEPAFGESIERAISSGTQLDPDRLTRDLGREIRNLETPPIVFLDAIEHLPRESMSLAFVDALLRLEPCPLSLVVTTRGSRPPVTTRLVAEGRAQEITAEDLSLRSDQLEGILLEAGIEAEAELLATLLARTRG